MPKVDDPKGLRSALQPFLDGNLLAWHGLPPLSLQTLFAAFGDPEQTEQSRIGWFPAQQITYPMEVSCGGLHAYVRNDVVIVIEALIPPPLLRMDGLGTPSTIRPHEILRPNAYVHEYLYCERGLVLSVAEPFEKDQAFEIVRCRGIRPLESPEEYGPEFYQAFEDQEVW